VPPLPFVALLGFGALLPAMSQSSPSFPMEPVVIRHSDTVIEMKADGTGEQTETMVVSVQSEAAAKQFSVVSTFYAKQSQHVEFVYVRVRHPDGSTLETPSGDVQEQMAPVTQQAPFYSDLMTKQMPVKGLRVGDTLEWQTRNVRTVAEAPNQFWGAESFSKDVVIEDQTVELRVPAGLKMTVRTNPDSKAQFSESDRDGQHRYHWDWKQLSPTVGPEAETLKKAKDAKPLIAEQEQDATEGALPDIAWTTFAGWEAVGAWYRGLEGNRIKQIHRFRQRSLRSLRVRQRRRIRSVRFMRGSRAKFDTSGWPWASDVISRMERRPCSKISTETAKISTRS
jgi:hypothetical protein